MQRCLISPGSRAGTTQTALRSSGSFSAAQSRSSILSSSCVGRQDLSRGLLLPYIALGEAGR
jgi:hypothetical protein